MRSRDKVLREMEQTLTEWANILSATKEKDEIHLLLLSHTGNRGIFLSSDLASSWAAQMRNMIENIQWMLRQRR